MARTTRFDDCADHTGNRTRPSWLPVLVTVGGAVAATTAVTVGAVRFPHPQYQAGIAVFLVGVTATVAAAVFLRRSAPTDDGQHHPAHST